MTRTLVATALLAIALPLDAKDGQTPVEQAQAAALAWLVLTDAGAYTESWHAAAPLLQQALDERQWQQSLAAARTPLGALEQRDLATATYTQQLPGAPDGEYVVVQFHSRFANKARAVETVTPMRAEDGSWKVAGYYIR